MSSPHALEENMFIIQLDEDDVYELETALDTFKGKRLLVSLPAFRATHD